MQIFDQLQIRLEGQKFIMSQAILDYTQSACPSSRRTPMLSKRVNWTIDANPTVWEPAGSCLLPWVSWHCATAEQCHAFFMLGQSWSRGCAKIWIFKLRKEKVQAEFKQTETMLQQLRWALGWTEDRMEPVQPCSGQRSRQGLKHSWFLMKPLCRAGDGSSGQDTVLA